MSGEFSYTPDKRVLLREALLSVWRGPRVTALLEAIAINQQDVEDAAFDIRMGLLIDTATGIYLDLWGRIYEEAREGLADVQYRKVIITKAYALRAKGTPPETLYVARELSNADAVVYPLFPAGYGVLISAATPLDDGTIIRIRRILEMTRPAGVGNEYIEGSGDFFRFDTGELDTQGLARKL